MSAKVTQAHICEAMSQLRVAPEMETWVNICQRAIELAQVEVDARTDQYITADEAKALGVGNAEYLDDDEWSTCHESCAYLASYVRYGETVVVKYRAIKKLEVEWVKTEGVDHD